MTDAIASNRFNALQLFGITVWPVVVAAVALRLAGVWGASEALADRPKVVVLDVQAAVQRELAARGNDDKALAAATEHVREYARSLRTAGYVVLDTSYVYAFPAEFETVPAPSAAPVSAPSGPAK